MKIFLIIFLLIAVLNITKLGIIIKYSAPSLYLRVSFGFIKLTLFPRKKKTVKKTVKKKDKPEDNAKDKSKDKAKTKTKKKFDIKSYTSLINPVLKALKGFLKGIFIDRFIVKAAFGGGDAAKSAQSYGYAWMAAGIIIPHLEKNNNVKKYGIDVGLDYSLEKTDIFLDSAVSLRIWHITVLTVKLAAILLMFYIRAKNNVEINKKGL